jgi:cytoskeletal protein RodZ
LRKILISLGAVVLLSACSPDVAQESTPSSPTTATAAVETSVSTSVPSPSSVVITSMHQQDPPDYVSTPNHSSIIKKEEVSLPAGKATLLTIEQDNFTAVTAQQPGAKTDTVYWLYLSKPSPKDTAIYDTYILSGLVIGDAATAKSELLEAAKTWQPLEK